MFTPRMAAIMETMVYDHPNSRTMGSINPVNPKKTVPATYEAAAKQAATTYQP
jgi:hypothetical protein